MFPRRHLRQPAAKRGNRVVTSAAPNFAKVGVEGSNPFGRRRSRRRELSVASYVQTESHDMRDAALPALAAPARLKDERLQCFPVVLYTDIQ